MTFKGGEAGNILGVDWKVYSGRKSPNDLRLEIRAMEWVPPSMALGFLFADFYAQNERTLATDGYLASTVAANPGARYINFIISSQRAGWEQARDRLEAERQAKRAAA